MKKLDVVQLPEACQLGSVIDRIILFKQDQVLSNICVQYKSKVTKKLANKDEYALLVEYILEFTDQTFEKLMAELIPIMSETEMKMMRLMRKIPGFKIQNMQKIDVAYRANTLIYFSDYEDRHGKGAALKLLPNHPDYAECRQQVFYLGTTYFDFVRNKEGKIVDAFLRLKEGVNASDALEWLVNDRESIKFFDCSSTITIIEYLSVLELLREYYGVEQGTHTFNHIFGSQQEIVPDQLRLLLSPLGTTVGVKTSLPRESTPAFNLSSESQTSDNPAEFPINPIAYFVGFKALKRSDFILKGQCGNQPVCLGENVTFFNHRAYVYKHPTGIFAGLNCIFVGKNAKGEDIYSGFGETAKTEWEINRRLVEAYNIKSKTQTELENSDNRDYRKLGRNRHIMLAAQFNVPDRISIDQVEGLAVSGSTEFLPEKLFELAMNIDELRQRIVAFTQAGMHQVIIPDPEVSSQSQNVPM